MSRRTPPPIAIRLLEFVLSEKARDAIVGDLIEEFAFRARASSRASATWWWQVARSIPLMLWSELRRRRSLSTLGVALAVYVLASVLEFVSTTAISNLFHPDAGLAYALGAVVGLATMVLGGYLAAAVRDGAAPTLAGIILIVVIVLFVTMPNSAPFWYGVTFLIAGPVAALAGGWLNATRRSGRTRRSA
jgi:hypothetical protein